MATVKSWANQKGGSGKSILSYNEAFFLAEQGKKVLYIDADEQGNGSSSLTRYATSELVASDLFQQDAVSPIEIPEDQNLVVVMADDGLIAAERLDVDDVAMVEILKQNLSQVGQGFDYIVVDTAGSNSRIANAMLVNSDFVSLPCRIDTFSIDVAKRVLQRVVLIQQELNADLVNLGILPNEFDATHPAQVQWLSELMTAFKEYVFPGFIPKRGSYKEAAAEGVPVWRLESDIDGESTGRVKTSARTAGREAKAVFQKMLAMMESNNG
ncbi:ParA family protein [Pseudomonas luteola]|uniref:ParA family protein n=1 Tax=Pseudomonas luteola TaxID=47886 RepID=UPI003A835B18